MNDETLLCPKCHSSQLHIGKRGFKVGRAAAASILTGNVIYTMLAGGIGQNDIEIVCLKCGHKFKPGQAVTARELKSFVMPEGVTVVKSEQNGIYLCDCGKECCVPLSRPICPKCGCRLSDKNKIDPNEKFKASRKGGCLGFFIIPPLILIALALTL